MVSITKTLTQMHKVLNTSLEPHDMEQIFAEAFRTDFVQALDAFFSQKSLATTDSGASLSKFSKKRIRVDLNYLSKCLVTLKFVAKSSATATDNEEAKTVDESACTFLVEQQIKQHWRRYCFPVHPMSMACKMICSSSAVGSAL